VLKSEVVRLGAYLTDHKASQLFNRSSYVAQHLRCEIRPAEMLCRYSHPPNGHLKFLMLRTSTGEMLMRFNHCLSCFMNKVQLREMEFDAWPLFVELYKCPSTPSNYPRSAAINNVAVCDSLKWKTMFSLKSSTEKSITNTVVLTKYTLSPKHVLESCSLSKTWRIA
jgi:hypothetical protein